MQQLQGVDLSTRSSTAHRDSDLSPFQHPILPTDASCAPQIACVGQVIPIKVSSQVSLEIKTNEVANFIETHRKVFVDASYHIGSSFVANYLNKCTLDAFASRDQILNEILSAILSLITERIGLDDTSFNCIQAYQSMFELSIGTVHYSQDAVLAIDCNEPFFIYSINDNAYPQFLRHWISEYLFFLAVQMGITNLRQGFIQSQLESDMLDLAGVTPEDFGGDLNYDALGTWVSGCDGANDFVEDFIETINGLSTESVAYSEAKEVAAMLLEHYKVSSVSEELKGLKVLTDEFEALCAKFPKAELDKNSPVHFFRWQLEKLSKIYNPNANYWDIEDDGDVALGDRCLVELESVMYSTSVDLDIAYERAYACGLTPSLRVDLSSPTAIESLTMFTVAELFINQICYISKVKT